MKKAIIFFFIYSLCVNAQSQNQYFQLYTDSAELKNGNDSMIREFEMMVKKTQPSFSFNGLSTESPNTFMPGQYRSKTNKIYQVTWPTAKPAMGPFLTSVMGSVEEGEKGAGLFFYGFFFPHEIGHALHYNTKMVPGNNYDAEYEANVIAVLYWRSKGRHKELDQCYAMAKKILPKFVNPVPENADAKQYITEHYNELSQNPLQYGYIQFSQIVTILEDKSLPDFDTYISKYFPK